jgi:hypothetical protein
MQPDFEAWYSELFGLGHKIINTVLSSEEKPQLELDHTLVFIMDYSFGSHLSLKNPNPNKEWQNCIDMLIPWSPILWCFFNYDLFVFGYPNEFWV